jgi:BirA family biotin operon repressor/biotin-[acetyl-CoA-carboxylase] ligase
MSAIATLLWDSPAAGTLPVGLAGWWLEDLEAVETTQALARGRPAWSAVVAREQTGGRGQGVRSFVSDRGGLYLTAVLPYAGDALKARGFALSVGWALRETLRRAGVRGLRLRWPNDLMLGDLKVGGILVEQGGPDTLLVGIGLNVVNRPWQADPKLQGVAGRLADGIASSRLPSRRRMVELVLRAIRAAHQEFSSHELRGFAPVLNRCWGRSRRVRLDLVGDVSDAGWASGWFDGIDPEGRVKLHDARGRPSVVPAHRIARLWEEV